MSEQSSAPWNLARFVQTLDYFGEVPFFGSIRWLQQMMGRAPNPNPNDITMLNSDLVTLVLGSSEVGGEVAQRLRDRGYPVRALTQADLALGENLPAVDSVVVDCAAIEVQSVTQLLDRLLQSDRGTLTGDRVVFDFRRPSQTVQDVWGALDDVVMGGVSESGMRLQQGVAVFAGQVSTANSGGFASVRSRNFEPPLNLQGYDGMRLRLKGDGQRYKFILRNSSGWDSPAYCYSFDTDPQTWMTVQVPFADLIPTFRAKTLETADPFDPSRVCSLQLMLSKFEYDRALNPKFAPGPFQLEIESIRAYVTCTPPKVAIVGPQQHEATQQMLQQVKQRQLPYVGLQYGRLEAASGDRVTLQSHPVEAAVSAQGVAEAVLQALKQTSACHKTAFLVPALEAQAGSDWGALPEG